MLQCNWSATQSLDATLEFLTSMSLSHARESGPYSADLVRMIESRDWAGLCTYDLLYTIGASAHHVMNARQALAFFTKLEDLDVGIDKEAAAYEKFVGSELQCSVTNDCFRKMRRGIFSFPRDVSDAFLRARRKIASILGPAPAISDLKCRFGPGATVSIKRNESNPTAKMAAGFECSTDALASGLLPELLREVPHWSAALYQSSWGIDEEGWLVETIPVRITAGNLAFVPKNATTFRSIVVEPCLNGFAQSGIGDLIARKLRSVGVDIKNQKLNQELALLGSLYGDLATIDLSSASDTIARELVRFLVPEDWYVLLAAFRTSEVAYRGQTIALEKFSSMGNGFTFPLETLIFWALVRATVPHGVVNAYGDDIICPSQNFDEVVRVLEHAGFSINRKKSYASGPFRESCGCDYYHGINVRPFYQKDLVSVRSLFVLHNWYVRSGDMERAASVRKAIPRPLRIYGPDGYGDGHLVSDEYPVHRKPKELKRGWAGHYFETFTPIQRKYKSPYPGDWVSPLYSIYAADPIEIIPDVLWENIPLEFTEYVPSTIPQGLKGMLDSPRQRPEWALPGDGGWRRTLIYTLG